jgi:hypothetical protein
MTCILAAVANLGNAPSASLVSLHNQSVSNGGIGSITASYSIGNDRTVKDNFGATLETWLATTGTVSNYQVRVTVTSGSLTSGTTGSWLSCSTTRTWSLLNNNRDNSTETTVFLVEIGLVSSGVVQASATIELDSTSYSFGGGH